MKYQSNVRTFSPEEHVIIKNRLMRCPIGAPPGYPSMKIFCNSKDIGTFDNTVVVFDSEDETLRWKTWRTQVQKEILSCLQFKTASNRNKEEFLKHINYRPMQPIVSKNTEKEFVLQPHSLMPPAESNELDIRIEEVMAFIKTTDRAIELVGEAMTKAQNAVTSILENRKLCVGDQLQASHLFDEARFSLLEQRRDLLQNEHSELCAQQAQLMRRVSTLLRLRDYPGQLADMVDDVAPSPPNSSTGHQETH